MTSRRPGAAVLFPGAGSGRDHPALVAVEEALAPLPVARVDFPYRLAGRRGPDRAPVLVGSVRGAAGRVAAEHDLDLGALVLGGRSMGGRMCSMAVAEGLPAAGLVLIAYPLHPPGRADRLRTEHFPRLAVPALFVSGTRDPFATPDELDDAVAAIPGPVTVHLVDGARHDLRGAEREMASVVAAWVAQLRGRRARRRPRG